MVGRGGKERGKKKEREGRKGGEKTLFLSLTCRNIFKHREFRKKRKGKKEGEQKNSIFPS